MSFLVTCAEKILRLLRLFLACFLCGYGVCQRPMRRQGRQA
jgi:hypothetical protein